MERYQRREGFLFARFLLLFLFLSLFLLQSPVGRRRKGGKESFLVVDLFCVSIVRYGLVGVFAGWGTN